jgi:hypothetical protein
VSFFVNNKEHLLQVLADTGASNSFILEAYISGPSVKSDDNNAATWIKMGGIITRAKTRI